MIVWCSICQRFKFVYFLYFEAQHIFACLRLKSLCAELGIPMAIKRCREYRWMMMKIDEEWYPLVNCPITMENHHFQWVNPRTKWAIFNRNFDITRGYINTNMIYRAAQPQLERVKRELITDVAATQTGFKSAYICYLPSFAIIVDFFL